MEDHRGHELDELLEALFKAREENKLPIELEALELVNPPSGSELALYARGGWISLFNDHIDITDDGIDKAELLVRRHRLAERLFSELLELDDSGLHSTSCSFEHVLDPAVTESICTILGHPPTCPHGKRIPPGDCCKTARREIAPIVISLKDLPIGSQAKIVFITTPHHQRLSRLVNLGVIPGGTIFLQQKRPSYLLRLGATEVAIDDKIAAEIFVRKI